MKTSFDLKKEITAIAIVLSSIAYGQVGINNTDPKATLDVTAKTTDGSKAEGIIAPRLTGDQIKAADTQYTSAQTGAIVYATAAVGTSTTKTANITDAGYYYFDGSVWQKMTGSGGGGTDINIYKDNGTLTGNRTVTMDDKTLFFNSTATTGTSHFNVDGSTFNVDAVNNRVGVGTTTPYANMEVKATTTTTVPDGIIIPKLTRLQLTNKGNTLYGANQKGALIYVTDITGGNANTGTPRVNVTSTGFFYFDGNVWLKFKEEIVDTNPNVSLSTTKSSRGLFNVSTVSIDSPISFTRSDGATVTFAFTKNNFGCITRQPLEMKVIGGTGRYANSAYFYRPDAVAGIPAQAVASVNVSATYVPLDYAVGPVPGSNDTYHYFLRNKQAPYDSYLIYAGTWIDGSVCGYSLVVTQNP